MWLPPMEQMGLPPVVSTERLLNRSYLPAMTASRSGQEPRRVPCSWLLATTVKSMSSTEPMVRDRSTAITWASAFRFSLRIMWRELLVSTIMSAISTAHGTMMTTPIDSIRPWMLPRKRFNCPTPPTSVPIPSLVLQAPDARLHALACARASPPASMLAPTPVRAPISASR